MRRVRRGREGRDHGHCGWVFRNGQRLDEVMLLGEGAGDLRLAQVVISKWRKIVCRFGGEDDPGGTGEDRR